LVWIASTPSIIMKLIFYAFFIFLLFFVHSSFLFFSLLVFPFHFFSLSYSKFIASQVQVVITLMTMRYCRLFNLFGSYKNTTLVNSVVLKNMDMEGQFLGGKRKGTKKVPLSISNKLALASPRRSDQSARAKKKHLSSFFPLSFFCSILSWFLALFPAFPPLNFRSVHRIIFPSHDRSMI